MHRLGLALALAGCGRHGAYPHQGGLVGQLEREIAALKLTQGGLRAELQQCADGALPDAVHSSLTQLFRDTEVGVDREGARVVLRLQTAFVYGDPYALRPRDEARATLDLVGTALAVNPGPRIEVHGHTDRGLLPPAVARRYRTQVELAHHQAQALAERLVREFGVDPGRIAVVAHGGNRPLASEETPDGQALNRRLEIHLVPIPP